MSPKIAVVHGPNLNLLGTREPTRYGSVTLAEIDRQLGQVAAEHVAELTFFQANGEGELVTHIQSVGGASDGVLINPAAYTHTSVAIRDALLSIGVPAVEVHLTNTHAREAFRHTSLIADVVVGRVMGFGALSYTLGLLGVLAHLQGQESG